MKNTDISADDWPARRARLSARRTELHAQLLRGQLRGLSLLEYMQLSYVDALKRPMPRVDARPALGDALAGVVDGSAPVIRTLVEQFESEPGAGKRIQWQRSAMDSVYCAGRAYAAAERLTVVEVDESLQYAMLLTDPPDVVREEDIVMPAEVFALAVPAKALGTISSSEMAPYVTVMRNPDDVREFGPTPYAILVGEVGLRHDQGGYWAFSAIAPVASEARFYRDVEEIPGIEEALKRSLLLRNYVYNVLLYLGGDDARFAPKHAAEIAKLQAIPKKSRRKVQQERLERLEQSTVYALSTAHTIDPYVKEYVLSGGLREARGSLKSQTMVRGHRKMQACGPGHALRKEIYVHPHKRGPQPAEQLSTTVHTYTVRS